MSPVTEERAAGVGLNRRRFTSEEYRRLVEVGILHEDTRTELIRGDILLMSAKGTRHVTSVTNSTASLYRQVADRYRISVQDPIGLAEDGEPEPDLALLLARADGYSRRLPSPSDVVLLVEVSDSSLAFDRTTKLPLYARAGLRESWLFDLIDDRIERHTDPRADGYRRIAIAGRGESLESTIVPGLAFAADEVLGPPVPPADTAHDARWEG